MNKDYYINQELLNRYQETHKVNYILLIFVVLILILNSLLVFYENKLREIAETTRRTSVSLNYNVESESPSDQTLKPESLRLLEEFAGIPFLSLSLQEDAYLIAIEDVDEIDLEKLIEEIEVYAKKVKLKNFTDKDDRMQVLLEVFI